MSLMNKYSIITKQIQFALAKNVIGDVITISPDCQPNAKAAKCKAAVPLETAQQ